MPDELWNEVRDIVRETGIKTIPMEKKCKKAKWLSGETLQIAVKLTGHRLKPYGYYGLHRILRNISQTKELAKNELNPQYSQQNQRKT